MNPPFGAQKAHADRPFIDCALSLAPVTYSIFNAGSIQFVKAYTAQKAEITEKIGGAFPIKRTFAFHTKDVQEIEVEILRLKRIV
jgi:putative methylase